MLQTIEGIYQNGKIKLSENPHNISESKVLITFIPDDLEKDITKKKSEKMIYFGMFLGENKSTEADFKEAEFHGDLDDNLDW